MDADNVNFDSDTSESWSLIDINQNGDGSINKTDSVDETEPALTPVKCDNPSGNGGLIGECSHEPEDGIEILHSSLDGDFFPVCSPNDVQKEQQDFQVLYKGRVFKNDDNLENRGSELNCSKTSIRKADKIDSNQQKDADNDTDCISVISESECNDFKFSTYETDDIWEDRLSDSNLPAKTHSNALKRKRKRLKLNYRESSEESVSSSFMIPDGKYYRSIDYKKSQSEMQMNEFPSAPVYRHYRNNVANTVLSLAMGVIFTGVACIAIGHFLGVHDAQQTAGEMMETLKRLQMENVLLHTRLTQLSRAFFSRGNAKLDLRTKEGPETCLDKYIGLHHNIRDFNEKELHQVGPIKHPMFFSSKSVDISSGIENPTKLLGYGNDRKKRKTADIPVKQTHDQNIFFNVTKYDDKYEKLPYSATTAKSETVYKKYFPSQNNVREKLTVVTNEGGRKFIVKESDEKPLENDCDETEEVQKMNCLAIREQDLSRFRWHLLQKKRRAEPIMVKPESAEEKKETRALYLYKYPQPEEYYKYEKKKNSSKGSNYTKYRLEETSCDAVISDMSDLCGSGLKNATRGLADVKKEYGKMVKRKRRSSEQSSKFNKRMKNRYEGVKRQDKMRRRESNVRGSEYERVEKDKLSKIVRKMKRFAERKKCKGDKGCNRKVVGSGKEITKVKEKFKDKHVKGRKIEKRVKARANEKVYKAPANRTTDECYGCWNKSGNWFCKWGKGRDLSRRDQRIREWMFDRARSRELSRIGDANWQFLRAMRRASSRNGNDDSERKDCHRCDTNGGDWFFKWALGREKCRRTRKLRERAKNRGEFSRKGDGNWQFGRAMAREHSRSDDEYLHNLKKKKKKGERRYSEGKGFSSYSYSWI